MITQRPRGGFPKKWNNFAFFGKRVLLPVGYPHTVSKNYITFVRYNMAQVACISLTRILSTQAMLLAVGLGQGGALPMAAVMSWLLKDGLGHLGSVLAGTCINTKFDSDPKKYKFISMSLGQAANLLAILSLARPGMFLVLTALSSALSRVGALAVTASRARIYENFSKRGNLGDLMRCSQAQSTFATLLGTAVGITLSPIVGADVNSILSVFAPVSLATHALAYKAVSVIEMRTINLQRMERIVDIWLAEKRVPTCAEVAQKERVLIWIPKHKLEINPPIAGIEFDEKTITELENQNFAFIGKTLFIRDEAGSVDCIRAAFEALGGTPEDWENFLPDLKHTGWDLSVAFIDNVDYRLSVRR